MPTNTFSELDLGMECMLSKVAAGFLGSGVRTCRTTPAKKSEASEDHCPILSAAPVCTLHDFSAAESLGPGEDSSGVGTDLAADRALPERLPSAQPEPAVISAMRTCCERHARVSEVALDWVLCNQAVISRLALIKLKALPPWPDHALAEAA